MRTQNLVKYFGVMAVLCSVAGSASALTLTIDRVAGYYSGNGGEFSIFGVGLEGNYAAVATVTVGNDVGFQSFCLEFNESLTIPGTYDYTIGTAAVEGGVAGGNPDPLGRGTAWLYNRFATGVLTGYNYTPGAGRVASASLMQQAVWYLEDEISLTAVELAGNSFLQAVITEYGSIATAKATATQNMLNNLGVRVINPTVVGTQTPRQSQLVYIGERPPGVADGGLTIGLLGLSLAGLGRIRRRLA